MFSTNSTPHNLPVEYTMIMILKKDLFSTLSCSDLITPHHLIWGITYQKLPTTSPFCSALPISYTTAIYSLELAIMASIKSYISSTVRSQHHSSPPLSLTPTHTYTHIYIIYEDKTRIFSLQVRSLKLINFIYCIHAGIVWKLVADTWSGDS